MKVTEALLARRSVRGFLREEVPRETLREIFASAQRAPSWCNIQPWRVVVTSGEATRRLTAALTQAVETLPPNPDFPWPGEYPEPYGTHRRECGRELYTAMGVARTDTQARHAAWLRNYAAFDAPHIAIVSVDRRLGMYAVLDVGCWLQSLLLVATEHGVSSCPEACLSTHPSVLRAALPIGDEDGVLFGIALGYEDVSVAANACRTSRAELSANVRFVE